MYSCDKCNVKFKTYNGFWKHNKNKHNDKQKMLIPHTNINAHIVQTHTNTNNQNGLTKELVRNRFQLLILKHYRKN